MLAIRLQRHGRKKYATYRFIIQESQKSPDSGRVVAQIGHYNPHTKDTKLDTEKVKFYLNNGARPSERVASILKKEKVQLPTWAQKTTKQKRSIKNPEKLRKNRPQEEQKEQTESEDSSEKPQSEEGSAESESQQADESAGEKTADEASKSEPESTEDKQEQKQ